MGLLDALNTRDGIFALGLLDAATPKPVRTSIGGGLLAALQNAQAWQQQQEDRASAAEERKRRAEMQAVQQQLMQAQIGETQAQAQQRAAAAAQAQQLAARQQQFQQALTQLGGTTPQQALAGGGGPTLANAARLGQQQPINWQALAAQFPEQVDHLKKLAEAGDWGRAEVARTVDGRDAQGRPVTIQFDRFGNAVGAPVQQWKAPEKIDTGGQLGMLDPVTMQLLAQFKKTQTPDGQASNAVAWANNALARQRLALDQQQPKGQYDADRGVMVDPRTGVASPVTMNGQPLGPKDKSLTDAQAKALLFGSRMQQADQIMARLARDGTTVQIPGANAGYGVGHVINQVASPAQQQLGQAKRDFINAALRRESGAVISESEFRNAELQYFPQVGDSDEVKAQKARNRALATRGILAEVPDGRRSMLIDAPMQGGMPSLDAIEAELQRRARGGQ